MKKLITIIIVLLIIIGAVLFYRNKTSQNISPTNESTQTQMEDGSVTTTATGTSTETTASTNSTTNSLKTFTVIGKNFSYDPSTITVNKGDTVKIIFKDSDGFHNLVIDGYNAKTSVLETGDQSVIQFVADKVGSFAYYCSVDGHRQKGMVGTLIVQ